MVITADDKHKQSGKMKAWSLQQLDDAEQVAVVEEDPSPVNTDESNEELLTEADHLMVNDGLGRT